MMHIADNHDALLDYLYEEGDPADRLKIARHLQTCATCSVAVLEFQTVRGMLSEWRPPASQLGFRIVQDQPLQSPTPRHAWWAPSSRLGAWAQAAAAVLLFAAGVAVSQLDVNYADGALTVRRSSRTNECSGDQERIDRAGARHGGVRLEPARHRPRARECHQHERPPMLNSCSSAFAR